MKVLAKFNKKLLLEQRLLEFKQIDKDVIMDDAENFTVSYEIELEYNGGHLGDTGDTRLGHANTYRDMIVEGEYEIAGEQDVKFFLENYFEDLDRDDNVDNLILRYLHDEHDETEEYRNELLLDVVKFQIATKEHPKHRCWFSDALKKIKNNKSEENKKFLKFISEKLPKHVLKYTIIRQMNFGFEKGEPYEEEISSPDPAEIQLIINKYFFDFGNNDVPSHNLLSAREMFCAVGHAEGFEDCIETAEDVIRDKVLEPNRSVTLSDFTSTHHAREIQSPFLIAIINMLSTDAESYIDSYVSAGMEEFDLDPEAFLEANWAGWDASWEAPGQELEEVFSSSFPEFINKWGDQLKFEEDQSLDNGLEFSINDEQLYMTGLDTALEFLFDFFEEYHDQDEFAMAHNTGLHTNIGYLIDDAPAEDYNYIKALMFLNHDFAVRGFEDRGDSSWAQDVKEKAARRIRNIMERDPSLNSSEVSARAPSTFASPIRKFTEKNWSELSDTLSREVERAAAGLGRTSIGFGITRTEDSKYIEFRYPGGDGLVYETMRDATLYYAYLVKLAADPAYQRGAFLTKMIGFVSSLKPEQTFNLSDILKNLKKGKIYRWWRRRGSTPDRKWNYASRFLDKERTDKFFGDDVGRRQLSDNEAHDEYMRFRNLATVISDGDYFIYKGLEKGKTARDSYAVFEVIGPGHRASSEDTLMERFVIEDYKIPLPKLSRLMNPKEESRKEIFKKETARAVFTRNIEKTNEEREATEYVLDAFERLRKFASETPDAQPIKENKKIFKMRIIRQ